MTSMGEETGTSSSSSRHQWRSSSSSLLTARDRIRINNNDDVTARQHRGGGGTRHRRSFSSSSSSSGRPSHRGDDIGSKRGKSDRRGEGKEERRGGGGRGRDKTKPSSSSGSSSSSSSSSAVDVSEFSPASFYGALTEYAQPTPGVRTTLKWPLPLDEVAKLNPKLALAMGASQANVAKVNSKRRGLSKKAGGGGSAHCVPCTRLINILVIKTLETFEYG